MCKSEKGAVLVVVLVLSAVSLAVMTALIYMITAGTQVSGLQKRYKTALEAAEGGGDIFYLLIATRAESGDQAALLSQMNAGGITFPPPSTSAACSGINSGAAYTGLQAKLMTPSTSWTDCDDSLTIDPADSSSYDMNVRIGSTTKYDVHAKIVATVTGNTGGNEDLLNKGVVSANSGEVEVMAVPYLYAIEVEAENSGQRDERAKLSVLYQY